MCVMLTHMRTATVREAQHNLPKILRAVARGEVVEITRRNRIVARLVPAARRPGGGLPDFVARARAIWGRVRRGRATSEVVLESRAERL
jgi:prevent-host-death family protein